MPDFFQEQAASLELARELADTQLLQELSSQLIAEREVSALYERVTSAAVSLMRSDFASMQMLDTDRDALRLLAHRGFTREAVEAWTWIAPDTASACSAARRVRARVMIPDVEASRLLSSAIETYRRAGIRAVQSTPLLARDGELVGMLSTHWRRVHRPSDRECALFDILARQAADLIQTRRGEDQLREAHAVLEQKVAERTSEVRELLARVVKGLEDERRRIGRDLHDHVGQQVTVLRINIELLAAAPSSEQADRTRLLAASLDRTVDALAWEFRPPELEGFGLSEALQSLVEEWSCRFDIAAECDTAAIHGVRFGEQVESHVYRIVQEALHNVVKHARAGQVDVAFARSPGEDVLTVRDNGIGFTAVERSSIGERHLGLINMRERAALIGGTLAIESGPAGTTVSLRIARRDDQASSNQPCSAA